MGFVAFQGASGRLVYWNEGGAVTTSETLAANTFALSIAGPTGSYGVVIRGEASITGITGTTGVIGRIRRGILGTGTLLMPAPPTYAVNGAAGSVAVVANYVDYAYDGTGYSFTLQTIGAAAASDSVLIECQIITTGPGV